MNDIIKTMKAKLFVVFLIGFILGQNVQMQNANAQSNASDSARVARALESIADTMKGLERKLK